jgi:hypothetical protein
MANRTLHQSAAPQISGKWRTTADHTSMATCTLLCTGGAVRHIVNSGHNPETQTATVSGNAAPANRSAVCIQQKAQLHVAMLAKSAAAAADRNSCSATFEYAWPACVPCKECLKRALPGNQLLLFRQRRPPAGCCRCSLAGPHVHTACIHT